MKKPLFLLFTLVLTLSITDQEVMQLVLNAAFEQNNLPDSTTIVPCFDDQTARRVVAFTGQILFKAAQGSITDILEVIYFVKDFINKIPQPVKNCLGGNKEAEAFALKYGIDGSTDAATVEKKVVSYVTLHYLQVHRFLGEWNALWVSAEFYNFGFKGASFAHKVLGLSLSQATSPRTQ